MMMGLRTFLMTMSSKTSPDTTEPGRTPPRQVLIRTPLAVPAKVQLDTRRPRTSCSPGRLPRLPTLMPWPGPQETPDTVMSALPGPTETQSSPVATAVSVMRTLEEAWMWTPSVLGLSRGARMVTRWMATSWLPMMITWKNLLSSDVTPVIVTFLTRPSLIDCPPGEMVKLIKAHIARIDGG
jgi:hypothetical protein